jgi:hypothetical protein
MQGFYMHYLEDFLPATTSKIAKAMSVKGKLQEKILLKV